MSSHNAAVLFGFAFASSINTCFESYSTTSSLTSRSTGFWSRLNAL